MKKFIVLTVILSLTAFVQAAIPTAGLQLYLDASSLTGYNTGDSVTTWVDLAGGDNSAVSTGTPTYIANALNGKAAIKIAGSSDRNGYGLTSEYDYYAIPTVSNVQTLALVFKPTSNTYYTWSTIMSGPTSDNYGMHGDTHWGNAYWDYAYSIDSLANSALRVNGGAAINGGYTGVDYDNFSIITIQLAAGTQFDLGFLAHTARYNNYNEYGMEVAELLVYNQQLSNSQLNQLTMELGDKYGIAVPEPITIALMGLGACLLRRK
jgi:hypothetical protein